MEFRNSGQRRRVALEELSDHGEIVQWQPTEEQLEDQNEDMVLKELKVELTAIMSPIKKISPVIEIEEVNCESLCEFEFIS